MMLALILLLSLKKVSSCAQYGRTNDAPSERYRRVTRQVIDISADNVEAEFLLADRNGIIGKLEKSVRQAFRGKDVWPYVYCIRPAFQIPDDKGLLLGRQKRGSIISVGTQQGFHPNVHKLVRHLQNNPLFCSLQDNVVLNKYFFPDFDVDWCRTRIRNVTSQHPTNGKFNSSNNGVQGSIEHEEIRAHKLSPIPEVNTTTEGYTFWESVLVFPLIAVFCIVLVLILSHIFFGRREGQQWRDYKTAKEQLDEYVSVRETQRHLRGLSMQRQLLLMARNNFQFAPRFGVHSFLQPKAMGPENGVDSVGKFNRSGSRLNKHNGEAPEVLSSCEAIPVGKQTVAEAAKQCGSSLHLYRNPLEIETEDENENDSLNNA